MADYTKMRKINRDFLFDQLCDFKTLPESDVELMPIFNKINGKNMIDKVSGQIKDEVLDQEFKRLLVIYHFGYYLNT